MIDIRDFVESDRTVKTQITVSLRCIVTPISVDGKLLHGFVPGLLMIAIKNAPGSSPRDVLQAGVRHAQPATVTKACVKISIAPQLGRNPTLFHALLVTL